MCPGAWFYKEKKLRKVMVYRFLSRSEKEESFM
jgi:hypothetical protein